MNEPSLNEDPQPLDAIPDSSAVVAALPRRKHDPLSIALAAWLVPGLGHYLQRCRGRALGFFVAVGGLAIIGFRLRGNVFPPHSIDPFGTLGFLADAASGIFYLAAKILERGGPDVARAAGDYGTRFIAAAGVVNLIAVFDAYEIASGRRR